MRPLGSLAVLAVGLIISASPALAQRGGKGQGAIVIRDDAPVYSHSKGPEIEWKMKRGDAVAGLTSSFPHGTFLFDEVDGRVHVLYFAGEQKGMQKTAWMDPKDLSRFTYDGTCGVNGSPFVLKEFSQRWNACFEEARDNKLDTLRVLWAQQDAPAKAAPGAEAKPAVSSEAKSAPAPEAKPATGPEAHPTPAVEPTPSPAPAPKT